MQGRGPVHRLDVSVWLLAWFFLRAAVSPRTNAKAASFRDRHVDADRLRGLLLELPGTADMEVVASVRTDFGGSSRRKRRLERGTAERGALTHFLGQRTSRGGVEFGRVRGGHFCLAPRVREPRGC